MIVTLKTSKAVVDKILELTGEKVQIDTYKEWNTYHINAVINGKKFRSESMYLPQAENSFLSKVEEFLNDKEEMRKQSALVDRLLFRAMMLEEVYCNLGAEARKELANLRVMEAQDQKDKTISRNNARANKRTLLYEAKMLKESASEFNSKKMRLITKTFEAINGAGAVEAKEQCIDYVIDAIDLLIDNSTQVGDVIIPAIAIKKKGCKVFKTIKAKDR